MVTVHQVDTPANDPPALDPIGNRTVPVNEVLTFTATATDPDVNTGPSGLVAHWPFDADLSSTTGSHHGTAAGNAAITGAPGQTILGGGALSLDGAGDYVNVGDIPLPGDLAVAAWTFPLNIDAGSDSKAVVVGDSDGDDFIRIQAADVRARFNGSTTSLTTNPDFVNGSWQHMALVRSGASITVYRNGQVVATGSSAQPFTPEFIGRKGGDYFGGLLDDVSVWDRALDPDEVAFLYGGGLGNPANALGSAGSGLTFSLLGDVPPGATIDGITGAFTWTAPPMPASYTFIVRVSDNGVPPLSDEEEITVTAFVPCSAADLDGDGAVGVVDFLMLLQTWGTDPGGPPDLDGNGNVGITDMLLLLGSWGPCA
jgi:hypothetical protein